MATEPPDLASIFGPPPPPSPPPSTVKADGFRSPPAGSFLERLEQEVAAHAPDQHAPEVATWDDPVAARFASIDRLWPSVNHVLSLIAQSTQLMELTGKFELTQDVAVDTAQHRRLHDALRAPLAQDPIPQSTQADIDLVIQMAYDEVIGISVLGPYWRDDSITEIMVDSAAKIVIQRDGALIPTPAHFIDHEHALRTARLLALKVSDRQVNAMHPMVTSELDRARITIVADKVVRSGIAVTIRKFRDLLGMDGLLGFQSLSPEMVEFLADAVRARSTIVVSGGTGTGKTTMINALSEYIPSSERIITIEDAFELALTNDHVVALQTKERASGDDSLVVLQEDLLVVSLRMRPDRIVVGEIRTPAAAEVMLSAANTGHDGTMTTIHADSMERAIGRLANLARQATSATRDVVLEEIASAINLVIHLDRRAGRLYVAEIGVLARTPDGSLAGMVTPVFKGRLVHDGDAVATTFQRVGTVGSDTALGMKFDDAGISRWST